MSKGHRPVHIVGFAQMPNVLRDLEHDETESVRIVTMQALKQAGLNKHEHICESLEIFAREVMPEFKAREEEREHKKAKELAPFVEGALARKAVMANLSDSDIPVFEALGRRVAREAKDETSIYDWPAGKG